MSIARRQHEAAAAASPQDSINSPSMRRPVGLYGALAGLEVSFDIAQRRRRFAVTFAAEIGDVLRSNIGPMSCGLFRRT